MLVLQQIQIATLYDKDIRKGVVNNFPKNPEKFWSCRSYTYLDSHKLFLCFLRQNNNFC